MGSREKRSDLSLRYWGRVELHSKAQRPAGEPTGQREKNGEGHEMVLQVELGALSRGRLQVKDPEKKLGWSLHLTLFCDFFLFLLLATRSGRVAQDGWETKMGIQQIPFALLHP